MRVTVYTKPGCIQCRWTFKQLDKDEIEYTAVDVTLPENEAEFLRIQQSGKTAMPQVRVDYEEGAPDTWEGFIPEKIAALKTARAA